MQCPYPAFNDPGTANGGQPMCAGNQCCPRSAQTNGQTYPCPDSPYFQGCEYKPPPSPPTPAPVPVPTPVARPTLEDWASHPRVPIADHARTSGRAGLTSNVPV